MAALGRLDDVAATEAVAAENGGQCRAAGVDVALAPVLESTPNRTTPSSGSARSARRRGWWRVDLLATNEKLRRGARRMLVEITGVAECTATDALDAAGGDTRAALRALLGDGPEIPGRPRTDSQ